MRKNRTLLFRKLMLIIVLSLISSCGGSSTDKTDIHYPNAHLLATQDDVKSGTSVIIDTRSADDYAASHIPGAINLTWQSCAVFGSVVNGVLKPVNDIETQLGLMGLTRDTRMIIYDNTTASWGSAGRIFWMLEYLGCTNLQILNGGWDKWITDANETTTEVPELVAADFDAVVNDEILATKETIKSKIGNENFVVIDPRKDEEYNGWQLYGEARGGHIKGAVQIPYEWYYNSDKTVLNYPDLKELFESGGVTADKEVTSYCTAGIRSGFVYFLGRLMGHTKVSNYDGSMWEWAAASEAECPMEKLENYDRLVYTSWLQSLVAGETPPGYTNDDFLIVESSWGEADVDGGYDAGHIPGSIHVNTDEFEGQEHGGRFWHLWAPELLQEAIEKMGITKDKTVIVYSCTDMTAAARLWWVLLYAGVEDVRLYNGTFSTWVAEGGAVETTTTERPARVDFGSLTFPVNEDLRATTEYVGEHYDDSDVIMADDRSWDEYIGEVSGYTYVDQKGRIPGAAWAHWGPSTYDGAEYLDSQDNTIRSFTEVEAMWLNEGITSDKEVIFYCGGGWRSSLTFFYAYGMDWPSIRNYSDGWTGWSDDQDDVEYPVETGAP